MNPIFENLKNTQLLNSKKLIIFIIIKILTRSLNIFKQIKAFTYQTLFRIDKIDFKRMH